MPKAVVGTGHGAQHAAEVEAITKWLLWAGAWYAKIAGGPLQRRGLWDFHACIDGRMIAIEVKTGTATLTDTQRAEGEAMAAAGVLCIVARNVQDVADVLCEAGLSVRPHLLPVGAARRPVRRME